MNFGERIVVFWFGAPGSAESLRRPDQWFKADTEFDREIRDSFGADYEAAAAGRHADLAATADGSLALIVLLDQFPRNMFRGSAKAFATDATALDLARGSVERGFDRGMPPERRQFLYMPYQHTEDLAIQHRSIELFTDLNYMTCLDHAIQHRDIIARFGRFPHRNAALGRTSTAEEIDFLKQPGSSF